MSEIKIYGTIGVDVLAADIKEQLAAAAESSETLTVRIDSPGGSVFEGFAIYDALEQYEGPKRCVIESAAFSIAALFPTAFDDVEITPNGYIMIHDPMLDLQAATVDDLKSATEMVSKVRLNYVEAIATRTGLPTAEVESRMKAETYYNADEAISLNLATTKSPRRKASRALTASALPDSIPKRVVTDLRASRKKTASKTPTKSNAMSETPQPATIEQIESAFPKASADFVLRCLKQSLPMASVATAAAEEMMAENEALKSQVEELTAKLSQLEAAAAASSPSAEEMSDDEEPMAEGMPEEQPTAAAVPGTQPVQRASGTPGSSARPSTSARARWEQALSAELQHTNDRRKAVLAADSKHPGLREQMLEEVATLR